MVHLPPRLTLFPYTTLFRSVGERRIVRVARQPGRQIEERLLGEAERTFPAARLGLGHAELAREVPEVLTDGERRRGEDPGDRKSTRLNSSHSQISYAVFCLK